jgi:hypothetical protein
VNASYRLFLGYRQLRSVWSDGFLKLLGLFVNELLRTTIIIKRFLVALAASSSAPIFNEEPADPRKTISLLPILPVQMFPSGMPRTSLSFIFNVGRVVVA